MRSTIVITALLFAPCLWAAADLPALTELAKGPAKVSALVIDLDSHETLAKLTPWMRLTPASVTKLYVTAATLRRWGPNHRFTTKLLTNGRIVDGVLEGDLIFLGAGDPNFDHARLWRLLAQLRQQGITRINGDLIINQSLFGDVQCLPKDRCEAHERSWHSYDAPLSSAGINFSTVPITVYPADDPSEPARVTLMPPGMSGFEIGGHVDTVSTNQSTSIWAWRAGIPGGNHIQISGQIAADASPYSMFISVTRAAPYTGRVLRAMASLVGIDIKGETVVTANPPHPSLETLASVWSPVLVKQLHGMLAYSNNYMADTLTLDLAAYDQQPSPKPLTLPRAARALEALAHTANAHAADWLPPMPDNAHPLQINSGSGLTVSNKIAARDIVALLSYMHRQDALAATFKALLPVPRFAPTDRLADDNVAWSTRIAAKTGTLTEPVSVFCYAGYIRLQNGDYGAFAMMVNGQNPDNPIPTRVSINAIQHDLELILSKN